MDHTEDIQRLEDFTPNQRRMATDSIGPLVIKYSLPAIIGMLVNALYNIVDRFWVGKIEGVGALALAGLGISMPLMNIILGLSQLVAIGAASCISIRLGRRDKAGAEQILGNSVSLIVILAVLVTVLSQIFLPEILRFMGASDASMPFAIDYARIIMAGCAFNMLSFSLNHPIRAAGNMKRFASTQLLGGVANMILDPIFIFTFGWGVKGAAYATILAQFISACWVIQFYFTKDAPLKIRLQNIPPKIKTVVEVFSIGFAPFFMQVMASFVTALANKSLITYGNIEFGNGDVAVGAMMVISSVSMLFLMPIFGFNQGTQPIIGFNYGLGNMQRVKSTYKFVVLYASAICVVGFLVIELFPVQIIKLFNDDPDLISVGAVGMRIFLSFIFTLGFQIPSINLFQSLGRAKISLILSLLRQFFLLIPAYIILPRIFGFYGIWYAMPLSDCISAIIVAFYVVREFKKPESTALPAKREVI